MRSVKNIHEKYDLTVVGSGPAGLAGAFFAAARGKKVLLLEKEKRFGGKLPMSGSARCNVTNILTADEQARVFGKKFRFLLPALKNFSPQMTRDFFKSLGVPIEVTDGFHCFPESGKASDLVEALLNGCREHCVECQNGICVEKLLVKDNRICGVEANGRKFMSDNVLLACGGKSYPKWSGSEIGYVLAKQAQHTITPLFPAMTGLQCVEDWPKECAGISFADAQCSIDLKGVKESCRGDLLFTHSGISAFAVIDLAGRVAELLSEHENVIVKINLFAEMSPQCWEEKLRNLRTANGRISVGRILAEYLPKRMIPFIVPNAETPLARYRAEDVKKLVNNLTSLQLHIHSTENWHKAMVTHGGVLLDEINAKTLESRLVQGLYFAGEIIDVDGPCGGYNIQWALSSGVLCGQKIR